MEGGRASFELVRKAFGPNCQDVERAKAAPVPPGHRRNVVLVIASDLVVADFVADFISLDISRTARLVAMKPTSSSEWGLALSGGYTSASEDARSIAEHHDSDTVMDDSGTTFACEVSEAALTIAFHVPKEEIKRSKLHRRSRSAQAQHQGNTSSRQHQSEIVGDVTADQYSKGTHGPASQF